MLLVLNAIQYYQISLFFYLSCIFTNSVKKLANLICLGEETINHITDAIEAWLILGNVERALLVRRSKLSRTLH
jgi:hypothetical protein